jgi:uncharacterized protein YhjY with autotransporter beta-barrel domain
VDIDPFKEEGAGLFDLSVSRQKVESLTTDLGVSLAYPFSLPWTLLQPTMLVEWEPEYLNNSRLISGTLVVDPTQVVFGAPTSTPDRNHFNLGAGITATVQTRIVRLLLRDRARARQLHGPQLQRLRPV